MRVEWFRLDLKDLPVHLYDDHKDKNTDQIQSYRGRTKLNHQELQRGNASLKLSSVRVSDEGRYKCFIESESWSDDATVDVRVEAVGSPPVITVDGFDRSGGLHLQCESEGWYPEPDLEWLDSEGVRLSSGTTETHKNTDRFSVKHTIIVYHSGKIHCRVKMKHHMLETLIDTSKTRSFSTTVTDVCCSRDEAESDFYTMTGFIKQGAKRQPHTLQNYTNNKNGQGVQGSESNIKGVQTMKTRCRESRESGRDDAEVSSGVEQGGSWETESGTDNRFISWRTSVILSSVFLALSVIAGLLIAAFAHKYREQTQLRNEKKRIQDERDQLSQSLKMIITQALRHLRRYRVNVILDADSAHPRLIVSDDGKQVRDGNRWKEDGKDRFSVCLGVLGKDGFSSGSFYFEVQVKDQTKWDLGVARESSRKSGISLSPVYGYWTVSLRDGKYRARDSSYVSLSLTVKPQRVGVFVDYEKGLVSFNDVESMTHIHSFTGQSFTGKLYPFVSLGYWENNNSTPLIICD